jgi:hypothetical protein
MIRAFTYRVANEEEILVVGNIISRALPNKNYEIYPMPQYAPDKILEDGDIAITFGTAAALAVRDCEKAIQHVKLPAPKELVNKEGNENTRDVAWNLLQDLFKTIGDESFIPVKVVIADADLPDLDARHMLMLHKLTEKSNAKFCIQTSKNGKTIAIGDSIPTDMHADIKISFTELYTIKNVMDILKIDKVELVNL